MDMNSVVSLKDQKEFKIQFVEAWLIEVADFGPYQIYSCNIFKDQNNQIVKDFYFVRSHIHEGFDTFMENVLKSDYPVIYKYSTKDAKEKYGLKNLRTNISWEQFMKEDKLKEMLCQKTYDLMPIVCVEDMHEYRCLYNGAWLLEYDVVGEINHIRRCDLWYCPTCRNIVARGFSSGIHRDEKDFLRILNIIVNGEEAVVMLHEYPKRYTPNKNLRIKESIKRMLYPKTFSELNKKHLEEFYGEY